MRNFCLIIIYIIKGDMFICLFVCLLPMARRTAGPIKTKLGIGTHVDSGSVLVKIKVMWCRRAKTTPSGGRVLTASLHNKRRYVSLPVCMLPMAGRTAGRTKTKLGIGTHMLTHGVF